MRGRRVGFSLVELVVILVVVGVLASAAVRPLFTGRSAADLTEWRDELLVALREARSAAVAKRRAVCVWLRNAPSGFPNGVSFWVGFDETAQECPTAASQLRIDASCTAAAAAGAFCRLLLPHRVGARDSANNPAEHLVLPPPMLNSPTISVLDGGGTAMTINRFLFCPDGVARQSCDLQSNASQPIPTLQLVLTGSGSSLAAIRVEAISGALRW
ncbi:MAG: hypothetical protein N2557_07055 [Hydrogenophilus sp.]|nr:hypothetical protein [Hydrogenophilus sp.]